MLQQIEKVNQDFKTLIEEEWKFIREVCPFVPGGEATAGHKFWFVFILGFPFIHQFSCEVCILYLIPILYIVYYFSFLSFIFQEL